MYRQCVHGLARINITFGGEIYVRPACTIQYVVDVYRYLGFLQYWVRIYKYALIYALQYRHTVKPGAYE